MDGNQRYIDIVDGKEKYTVKIHLGKNFLQYLQIQNFYNESHPFNKHTNIYKFGVTMYITGENYIKSRNNFRVKLG
jgi:hypothetical protein